MKDQDRVSRVKITQERLKSIVNYDPETGDFYRIKSKNPTPERFNGSKDSGGYLTTSFDGIAYSLHRLAWLYVYGEHPDGCIDHIDGDRVNNRIANLRVVSRGGNAQNRRSASKNKAGLIGVFPSGKKWGAMIALKGERKYLGSFDTPVRAHQAYLEAKKELHPYGEIAKHIELKPVKTSLKTYIAGPMTGYENLNFSAFHAEAAKQRAAGHEVINPAEINGGADELAACAAMNTEELAIHWKNCMRRDIAELVTCERIVMLSGWSKSRGATVEHYVAKTIGLVVEDAMP